MAAVFLVVSLFAMGGMLTGEGEAVGLHVSLSSMRFWIQATVSTAATVGLIVFIDHTLVRSHQQIFIAGILAALLWLDVGTTARFPLAYGLTACVLQVMSAYLLFRLRVGYAVLIGVPTSLLYLGWSGAAQYAPDPTVTSALQVNVSVLTIANVILAVGSYQIERLDRLAFLGTHHASEKADALAEALHQLESAQAQLLESERQVAVGQLAAGLLHEINTPLGVVSSTSGTLDTALNRLLAADGDRERTVSAARQVLAAQGRAAGRLSEILESLERFVDLDRDGPRRVDARDGLRDALSLLAVRLEGVDIQTRFPEEPMIVRCDPARLNAAFYAVLDNAATALSNHGTLAVNARSSGGWWRIDIIDDGPGVPSDLRPHLFEPGLTRSGHRVKLRMGLPTARRAMEAIGGHLRLLDEDQAGAAFRFEWPAIGSASAG